MTLLADADARLDAMIVDAAALIRCESPSEDLAAVARSAEETARVIGARFGEAGLPSEPERIEIDGVVHLRWSLGDGPRRVMLLGHHDTVWPVGTLERIPFSVVDGVMRGPGCFDMIVGVVQAAHAVAMLAARDGAASVDGVTLLVSGDEEVGSLTSRGLIEDEARRHDAVLVLEAAGPGGALKTARKGVSWYELEARGRAAHSGLEPERGVNAGIELAHQVLALAHVADTAAGTTVTPTRGVIGTTGNTVPAAARVNVDVRARTAAEQDRVEAHLKALAPVLDGAEVTVHGGINRRPLQRADAAALYERAVRLAPSVGLELSEIAVGGASDGNFTAGVGTPTLDGLGAVGGGAHAKDEHVLVAHIPPRTALVALLVEDLIASPAR
ncbi:M20/M25/M40 family metallo-hydrolase [Demequina mangrovi]|uniref:Glutamate carboxypeptidase n=1 Tax=Demequina mangrovi TaxID=1043493 RepID=A0A1H6YZW5_9MICO|nr:M20/M25/M40 family metallo-hydrolase [Demequina mangrovi]SEJ44667.1 glutamate carboxypeptidase [Demequina mangrovi]